MKARKDLYVVNGGDHSLKISSKVLKGVGKTQAEVEQEILVAIESFLSRLQV